MDKNFNVQNIPEEYRPISMWGYFGYQLLFSIPILGLVLLIAFSFSDKNINRRNFARSYFCILIIVLIIVGILFATGLGAGLVEQMSGQV